jgi:hypothetical protein
MEIWQSLKRIAKLILISLVTGFSLGWVELNIGHRYILDKILLGKDPNFVYEYFWAPTYYGLTKSIVVAITFFLIYLSLPQIKLKPVIIGIMGTLIFGIYYYFTFPQTYVSSSLIIGIVHFVFITVVVYISSLLFDYK